MAVPSGLPRGQEVPAPANKQRGAGRNSGGPMAGAKYDGQEHVIWGQS